MVARPPIGQQWTVEQYLEMERASIIRHELVDGRVYAMAGGDQDHGSISINVCAALADRLDGRPCRVFNTDMKVRLANEQAFVYPDASVTCDPRDLADRTADFIRFPCLVVEVLSASTERYDRGAKYDLYRGRGVLKEYMLRAFPNYPDRRPQRQLEELCRTKQPMQSRSGTAGTAPMSQAGGKIGSLFDITTPVRP